MSLTSLNAIESPYAGFLKPVSSVATHEKLLDAIHRLQEIAECSLTPDSVATMMFIQGEILDHLIELD